MNRRSPVLISAPAQEPVTLSEAKVFLKVEGTDEDALITSLIATSRRACEDYCKRAFITQTMKLVLDRFPIEEDCDFPVRYLFDRCERDAVQLPRQPIQSITSIKCYDLANAPSTVDPAEYMLDAEGGRAVLNDGFFWPTLTRPINGVEIITVNGYGASGASVPDPIKQAILQYVYAMYENRVCASLPEGACALLAPYRSAEAFGAW